MEVVEVEVEKAAVTLVVAQAEAVVVAQAATVAEAEAAATVEVLLALVREEGMVGCLEVRMAAVARKEVVVTMAAVAQDRVLCWVKVGFETQRHDSVKEL